MVYKYNIWCEPANAYRTLHIHLPNNYYESNERYAVLYMFDGQNLFFNHDATFGRSLGLKEFLDRWWKGLIVVGISCADDDRTRIREYCPFNLNSTFYGYIEGRGEQTLEWISNRLKPHIDETFRTAPQREATAIAGYSMGGMMSLYGVLHFNRTFSKAAVISPALRPAMEQFREEISNDALNPDTRIFFSWGTTEEQGNPGLGDRVKEIEWLVQQQGVRTYLYQNNGGTHNEASWENEVPHWMKFLWE